MQMLHSHAPKHNTQSQLFLLQMLHPHAPKHNVPPAAAASICTKAQHTCTNAQHTPQAQSRGCHSKGIHKKSNLGHRSQVLLLLPSMDEYLAWVIQKSYLGHGSQLLLLLLPSMDVAQAALVCDRGGSA